LETKQNGRSIGYLINSISIKFFSQQIEPSSSNAPSASINFQQLSRKRPAQISTDDVEQSETTTTSSDEDDQEPINDEEIRKALQPTPIAPPPIKRRQREDSTSDIEEPKVEVPARPHANVEVDRTEEIQAIRSQLPIITEEQSIMEAIHDNLVVLVCGETGSGKTTQLPQFLYEAGYTLDGKMIGITEPRRVAAISMANRVAQELNMNSEFVKSLFSNKQNFAVLLFLVKFRIKFVTKGRTKKKVPALNS